jgi:hypothetical protein
VKLQFLTPAAFLFYPAFFHYSACSWNTFHKWCPFYRGKSPSHGVSKIGAKFIIHLVSRFDVFERKSMGEDIADA